MFCTNCGTQNPDEARFCSGCGCDLHLAQAAGTQPAKGEAPKSNGQEKKVKIKSPASAKIGLTLGIIAMVLAAVSTAAWMLDPIIRARFGLLSIVLSIPAIVLSAKGLNRVNRNYREIAMQNIVYRDDYNKAKYVAVCGIAFGIIAIIFGFVGTYASKIAYDASRIATWY